MKKNIFIKIVSIFIIIYCFHNYFFFKYYNTFYNEEKTNFDIFLSLKDKDTINNNSMINDIRESIINKISEDSFNNVSYNNTIFFNSTCRFGNCLVFLNKIMFFCQFINCKSIILNKDFFWFIKNKIIFEKYNISITIDDINNYKTCFVYNSQSIFFDFFTIKPEIRIHLLRNEILLNLPKYITSNEELFIHIRSGDIFEKEIVSTYSQPPLCFYDKIINNFYFKKIYILSSSKNNPVIQKLINKYNNLVYQQNSLKLDIALLINAFNIVASVSSFLYAIIQININLRLLWDYNMNKIDQKMRFYHYDLYRLPFRNFTIFRMEPSINYNNILL